MPIPYHHPVDVLSFAAARNSGYAIIVVTAVTGGAMRAPGAMMCVSAAGEVAGYISNGCVDADIVFQAKEAIKTAAPRQLHYGEGSPFKDIELPCGGRIDLWVIPNPPDAVITEAYKALKNRQAYTLSINAFGGLCEKNNAVFSKQYGPKLKVRIAGRGEAVKALAKQALKTGFEIVLQSPEPEIGDWLDGQSFEHLMDPARVPDSSDDAWTAVVLMFHDHDWEPGLLSQALAGEAFYIGAMGSERTHSLRRQTLMGHGVSVEDAARVKGPIGLIPSMRDANLLALSTLAEIVAVAQEKGRL